MGSLRRNPDRQSVLQSIVEPNETDVDTVNLIAQQKASGCLSARRILSLLAFIGFANVYAMRVNLSVAIVAMVNSTAITPQNTTFTDVCPAPPVNNTKPAKEGEFVWEEPTQSLILGSFFWGYVFSNLVAGRIAEFVGGKRVFGAGILITSVLTLLTPIAANTSVIVLIALRVIIGLGEGVTFPAMNAMLAKWIPPNERSQTNSIVFAGAQMGTVISMPISGILCQSDFLGGWPSAFYVFGVLGIFWVILWMVLIHESPETHPRISNEERNYILTTLNRQPNQKVQPLPYMKILTSMPFWAILVSHFAQNWGFYTLLTELPSYLKNIQHFDLTNSGFISALPYLVMWLFSLLVGFVADYFRSTGKISTGVARRICNSIGLYGPMVCLLLVYFTKCNTVLALLLITMAVGFNGAIFSGCLAGHLDIAPNYAGTLLGMTNSAATIPGFVAPMVTGILIKGHESLFRWQIVFWIACVIYFIGNTFYLIFMSGEVQPWNFYGKNTENSNERTPVNIDTVDGRSSRSDSYGAVNNSNNIPEVF